MMMARPGDTEDLSNLSDLDESILLEELKIRYLKDKIYVCQEDFASYYTASYMTSYNIL